MKKLLVLASLVLAAPSVALACGDKPCEKSGCKMPAAGETAGTLPAEGTKASLTVTGMKCGACAAKIKTALDGTTGVKGSVVDANAGTAEVAFDAAVTDADKLAAVVNGLGHFTATVKK